MNDPHDGSRKGSYAPLAHTQEAGLRVAAGDRSLQASGPSATIIATGVAFALAAHGVGAGVAIARGSADE